MTKTSKTPSVADAIAMLPQHKYEALRRVFDKFPEIESQFLSLLKEKIDALEKGDSKALREIALKEGEIFSKASLDT